MKSIAVPTDHKRVKKMKRIALWRRQVPDKKNIKTNRWFLNSESEFFKKTVFCEISQFTFFSFLKSWFKQRELIFELFALYNGRKLCQRLPW